MNRIMVHNRALEATRRIAMNVYHVMIRSIDGFKRLFFALYRSTNYCLQNNNSKLEASSASSDFAASEENAPFVKADSGLLVGRDAKTGKLLRYDGSSHLLTLGTAYGNNNAGTVVPNMLTLARSIVCMDFLGRNALITCRARSQFGPVYTLDPFGLTGKVSAAFNPLQNIDPDDPSVAEGVEAIAGAFVDDNPGQTTEVLWNDEARALIGGLILHIVAHEPWDRRTLSILREYLTLEPIFFREFLEIVKGSTEAGGLIACVAQRYLEKTTYVAERVLATARNHTNVLDIVEIAAVMERSDFSFADLKACTATVFIVLPPDRIRDCHKWLRLMVTQSLTEVTWSPSGKPPLKLQANPVLYLLDHCEALARVVPIQHIMRLVPGYGIQFWVIARNARQLEQVYGDKAGIFFSNAAIIQMFDIKKYRNSRLASALITRRSHFPIISDPTRKFRWQKIGKLQKLIDGCIAPIDQIENLPENVGLLVFAGKTPIITKNLNYLRDEEFRTKLYVT